MSHQAQVVATRTGLFGRLQLATLENGVLPIPANLSIALEIGASDRDTLDVDTGDRRLARPEARVGSGMLRLRY